MGFNKIQKMKQIWYVIEHTCLSVEACYLFCQCCSYNDMTFVTFITIIKTSYCCFGLLIFSTFPLLAVFFQMSFE